MPGLSKPSPYHRSQTAPGRTGIKGNSFKDMRIPKAYALVGILAALIAATSCETTQQKRAAANPPPQAIAPTVVPTPQPAKLVQKPAPRVDPVDELIARVEKEYQAGQASYYAGHLEGAKENFDRAFTILLESPLDVRGDERLQQEFDKIVEGVHSLELLALQQGDGFSEQKPEPAPIDEANEITFPVDPNVKAKAEAEVRATQSDLPLVLNDRVASYISYYSSKGRGFVERALVRSGRYRDMILRILKEEGVPQDLIFLAQAESGFHPLALSRAGARGMWQFMASRASGYGLERNWWLDERQDPEKATRAAARHLKDLYNQFGDWYLAMAAYNSGPGRVQRAVQRTGYADFWELYDRGVLPRETRNYVPIILAMTIMSKNPAQYGLNRLIAEPALRADTVKINYPVDLRLVAECVDSSVGTLHELNPSLLRMTTPKDREFELRLPAGTKEQFVTAIAAVPRDMRVWWRYHKVAPGETFGGVAKKYRTTSNAIAQANNLRDDEIAAGEKLIIPVPPGRRAEKAMAYSKRITRYRVRKGDTVLSVADDFSVPAERLRRWNRLKGNALRPGRVLVIHRPLGGGEERASRPHRTSKSKKTKNLSADVTVRRYHKVKRGETLTSIADSYNTSVAALRRTNRNVANLRPGDLLVIPAGQ
jgi:membrane-bound lytic murein transglycosylase D